VPSDRLVVPSDRLVVPSDRLVVPSDRLVVLCAPIYLLYIYCLNLRRPPTNRKLWEKSSDKWSHDLYIEDDQRPKTKEERMV